MDPKKVLVSAVAAIATSKIAQTVAHLEFSDVLGAVGLERRRSHALENLGLIALGAVALTLMQETKCPVTWRA